jgi:hypothetical protein
MHEFLWTMRNLNGFEKTEARWHFFFFGQVTMNFIKSEKPALQLTSV